MNNKILAKWAHFIIHEISTICYQNLDHTMTESTGSGKGRRSCTTNGSRLPRWPSPSFHTHLVAIRLSTLQNKKKILTKYVRNAQKRNNIGRLVKCNPPFIRGTRADF